MQFTNKLAFYFQEKWKSYTDTVIQDGFHANAVNNHATVSFKQFGKSVASIIKTQHAVTTETS